MRIADGAMKVAAGLRYEGTLARGGHVESWRLKANDPRSRRAIGLKWTRATPGTASEMYL